MSDRPTEIWCDTGLYWDYKDDWSEGSWRGHDNFGGEKYVRADLIEETNKHFVEMADRIKELEAQISAMEEGMTAVHMAGYMDGRKAAEATLRKLEYWFDTDQEILDVMGNDEKADHMRKLKMIRDALKGGKDE